MLKNGNFKAENQIAYCINKTILFIVQKSLIISQKDYILNIIDGFTVGIEC